MAAAKNTRAQKGALSPASPQAPPGNRKIAGRSGERRPAITISPGAGARRPTGGVLTDFTKKGIFSKC